MNDRLPPGLDRSRPGPAGPAAQALTQQPQQFDSPDAKLAKLKAFSLADTPVRVGSPMPCSSHWCLNLTTLVILRFDMAYQNWSVRFACQECLTTKRP